MAGSVSVAVTTRYLKANFFYVIENSICVNEQHFAVRSHRVKGGAMTMDPYDDDALPAPQTFDGLRQRIRDRFASLSPHLKRIARASLEEPNSFALNTTPVIAEALKVQPSTLIRFAKEFGYNGFSDMQRIFRQRLIEGAVSVRDKVLDEGEPTSADDLEAMLKETVRANTQSLTRLVEACDLKALGEATQMLRSARHVYVAGLRRSRPIADYLVYGLIRAERAASHLDFAGGMAGPQTSTMKADDVLVAIAFTPYSTPVVEAVMDAHVSGRRIVALTDNEKSPLAHSADVVLTIEHDSAHRYQPISGAIALVQTLIVAVTAG